MIKAVCFDLDGTLLPMDLGVFCRCYFGMLGQKLAPYGYDPAKVAAAVVQSSKQMYKNDGSRKNEDVFWESFCESLGEGIRAYTPVLDEFYENDFDRVREVCGFDEEAAKTLSACREKGLAVAIATNPLFPEIATRKRLLWAGIDPQSVAFYTTFEDSSFCKPKKEYYLEVASRLGVDPAECLMVGNDMVEDMAARHAGMKVFLLLNEGLINPNGEDVNAYPHGGFAELLSYIDTLS